MSKLFDSIRIIQAGVSAGRIPLPMSTITGADSIEYSRASDLYKYSIQVTLSSEYHITRECVNSLPLGIDAFDEAKTRVGRLIAEEVFGEYREPLLKAIVAATKTGNGEVICLLDGVLKSMFNDK